VVEHLLLSIYLKWKTLIFGRIVAQGRYAIRRRGVRQLCVLHYGEVIFILIWQTIGPTAVDQIVMQNLTLFPGSLHTPSTAMDLVGLFDQILCVESHAGFYAFFWIHFLEYLHIIGPV
jgi:hypothetical protein